MQDTYKEVENERDNDGDVTAPAGVGYKGSYKRYKIAGTIPD